MVTTTPTARSFLTTLRRQVPTFLNQIVTTVRDAYGLDLSDYPADHVCWRTERWEEYTQLVQALKDENEVDQQHQEEEGQQQSLDDGHTARQPIFRLLIESDIGGRPISTFELVEESLFLDGNNKNNCNYDGSQNTPCSTTSIPILIPPRRRRRRRHHHHHHHHVSVIEIPSPKPGKCYPSGLEHVEFILPNSSTMTIDDDDHHHHQQRHHDIITPLNDNHHQRAFDTFMKQYPNIPWNTKAMKSKRINPDISFQIPLVLHDTTTMTSSTATATTTTKMCSVKFHLMPLKDVIAYEKTSRTEESIPTTL